MANDLVHPDFFVAMDFVYHHDKFLCSQPQVEIESSEYGACTFKLNGLEIRFRIAKTTPTKIGQFVTLWKRVENGPIQPYDISDSVDFFVISTRQDKHFGQFIFPKSVLCKQGIVSKAGKEGKRAIRIYPPWVKTLNQQAQKTQKWQLEFFLDTSPNKSVDEARVQMLYSLL